MGADGELTPSARTERIVRGTRIAAGQIGCTERDAMTLLMARSEVTGEPMEDIALRLIVGTLDFGAD